MASTILIIEDDQYISELIEFNLQKKGYEVIVAKDANEGLMFLKTNNIDLILLDLMLPGLQGEEFVSVIKNKESLRNIPIIVTTAKSNEDLIVKLIETGVDDFLTKPFSIKVLIAKIAAVLRRVKHLDRPREVFGIEIIPEEFVVKVDNEEVELTKTEFDILKLFIENKGKVLSRERILQNIRGLDSNISDRNVDVHISNIRKKLKNKSYMIKSIPKVGYKFG